MVSATSMGRERIRSIRGIMVSLVVLVQAIFRCRDFHPVVHGRFLLGRSVSDGATVGGVARVAHRCPLAPA